MVGCIALAFVQYAHQVAPDWNGTFLLLAPVLAAFAGHTSYRALRRRYVSGSDRLRLEIFELIIIFLLIKATTYFDSTFAEIWQDVRRWQDDVLLFFDMETLVTFALAAAAWFSTRAITRDLEAVADPLLYKGEASPMERLNKRFLIGSLILLFFSGLARIEIASLLNPDRPNVSGLALNVLVYFVLGLIVLGQVRFTWLRRLWQQQKFTITGELGGRWLRYTLVFLAIALLIAFILPTQYTVGLLDLARYVLSAIGYIITVIVGIFMLIINLLLSLLFPKSDEVISGPATPSRPIAPPLLETPSEPVPWLLLLRSILFWVIALGTVFYIVRSYLRDRPDLLESLKRFRVTQIARRWWCALTTWWRGFRRAVHDKLPSLSLNFLRRKDARRDAHQARRKGQALREQIYYYYLDTLDRAKDEGLPRSETQTPYEYQQTLEPNLPEAQHDVETLTEAFVAARYSEHPITEEDIRRLQTTVKHVHAALDERRKARENERKNQ